MNNLRRIRLKQNISQEQLAKETGLTEATINRIETGRSLSPHFRTRRLLARILDVKLAELGFDGKVD